MQLQSLREQIQARTGQDPLAQMLPSDTGMEFETRAGADTSDPAMEISITVEGLPNDSTGLPPNPFAVVYIIVPPQQQTWLQQNHTEMVEVRIDRPGSSTTTLRWSRYVSTDLAPAEPHGDGRGTYQQTWLQHNHTEMVEVRINRPGSSTTTLRWSRYVSTDLAPAQPHGDGRGTSQQNA